MEFVYRELQIEPTNRCNLHCSICSHTLLDPPKARDLTFAEFKSILERLKNNNIERVFLQGLGEPFLNRELNAMILYASQRNIFVYTTTNGNILNEEIIQGMISCGLNELRVSIDAPGVKLYEQIKCGGKLERVIDAVKLINKKKKECGVSRPTLRLNAVAMKDTISQLPQLIHMAASLGFVEVSLIPLVVHGRGWATDEHNISVLAFDELKGLISQAKKIAGELGIELVSGVSTQRHSEAMAMEQPVAPKCYYSMYVQSNGDFSPCCNIPLRFGNLFDEEIADILNGEKMSKLRAFIQQAKPSCHNCVNFAYNLMHC